MDAWLEFAKVTGPVVALLFFFVWRDWLSAKDQKAREHMLGQRLDVMVDRHSHMTEEVIVNNTAALNGLKDTNRELREEIRNSCRYNQNHFPRGGS